MTSTPNPAASRSGSGGLRLQRGPKARHRQRVRIAQRLLQPAPRQRPRGTRGQTVRPRLQLRRVHARLQPVQTPVQRGKPAFHLFLWRTAPLRLGRAGRVEIGHQRLGPRRQPLGIAMQVGMEPRLPVGRDLLVPPPGSPPWSGSHLPPTGPRAAPPTGAGPAPAGRTAPRPSAPAAPAAGAVPRQAPPSRESARRNPRSAAPRAAPPPPLPPPHAGRPPACPRPLPPGPPPRSPARPPAAPAAPARSAAGCARSGSDTRPRCPPPGHLRLPQSQGQPPLPHPASRQRRHRHGTQPLSSRPDLQ